MSYSRLRRTRRVNNTDSDTEDSFEYNEGDLTTLQTNEALDLEFRIRILSDLLICSLCRGYFRDAMTIKECSHTCKAINKVEPESAFEGGRLGVWHAYWNAFGGRHSVGEPTGEPGFPGQARADVSPFRRDVTIQNLVDKLFPRFAFEEAREKAELEAIMRNADMEAPTRSKHEDGIEPSTVLGTDVENLGEMEGRSGKSDSCAAGSTGLALLDMSLGGPAPLKRTAPLGGWEAGDEWYKHIAKGGADFLRQQHWLNVSLSPVGRLQEVSAPFYIRTSGKMQVVYLASYIARKFGVKVAEVAQLELLLEGQVLAHSHTLEFACRSKRVDTRKCVPIQFRYLDNTALMGAKVEQ